MASYVISASLAGCRCSRHIRISEDSTFETLALAILSSFRFDCDHLYSFFLDNRRHSGSEIRRLTENGEPDASRCTLSAGLAVGQPFLFLFDYGDEWLFRCKVQKLLDEQTDRPVVVRETGTPPDQYGWSEEDGEEED